MKRIISLTLTVLMLTTLLLAATSCGMESMSGYTLLRDHIIDKVGYDKELSLNEYATIKVTTPDGGDSEIHATIGGYNPDPLMKGTPISITLKMDGSVEKAHLFCEVQDPETRATIAHGSADVLLTHYTGSESISFTSMENVSFVIESATEEFATVLLNSLLLAIDTYTTENLDLNAHDLGFIALSDKYMADVDAVEAEEDLGGAFSSARMELAIMMLLQGVGMVFLVLAILWIVLLIFKAVFYRIPPRRPRSLPSLKRMKLPLFSRRPPLP